MTDKMFQVEFIHGLFRFKQYGFDKLQLSTFNANNLIVLLNDSSFTETKPESENINSLRFKVGKNLQIDIYTHDVFINQYCKILNLKSKKSVYINPSVLGFYQGYSHKKLRFFIGNGPFERPSFRNVKKMKI